MFVLKLIALCYWHSLLFSSLIEKLTQSPIHSVTMVVPNLIVTAEERDFDPVTIQHFRDESFQVSYLPFDTSKKDYEKSLHGLADPLEEGEKYAIVGLCSPYTMALAV